MDCLEELELAAAMQIADDIDRNIALSGNMNDFAASIDNNSSACDDDLSIDLYPDHPTPTEDDAPINAATPARYTPDILQAVSQQLLSTPDDVRDHIARNSAELKNADWMKLKKYLKIKTRDFNSNSHFIWMYLNVF